MENSTATSWIFASDTFTDYTKLCYPALIVFFELVVLAIILGNVLTIVAYAKTVQLQTPTNLLICNQSFIDLSVSFLSQPFFWLSYTQWGITKATENKWLCLFGLFSIRISSVASIAALMLLSVERSVAIFLPFRYYTIVNDMAVRKAIVASWLISFLVNAPPLFGWNTWTPGLRCFSMYIYSKAYNMLVYTAFCLVCLLLTALMSISIAVVAIKKGKLVDPSSAANPAANPGASSGSFKVTKMLLKVVGIFYLCWMPYLLLTVYYTITPAEERKLMPDWLHAGHDFSKALVDLNSLFNPFIYAHVNPQCRSAFRRLLRMNRNEAPHAVVC